MEKLREALARVEALREINTNEAKYIDNTKYLIINNLLLVYIAVVATIGLFR